MKHIVLVLLIFFVSIIQSCDFLKWNPFNIKKQHIAALILARGGSKSIPLKNLSTIGNKTLLINSLEIIKKIEYFSSIWVSTDNFLIASEATGLVKVNLHWRTDETATDTASSLVAVKEFIEKHQEIDVIALIQCTSPFLREKFLLKAISIVNSGIECVFSVTRSFKLRWLERDGEVFPLNFNPEKRPRRQDWNGEFVENGMFYFFTRKIVNYGSLQTKR